MLEFLILIALLRVQVVQTGLVGKVDIIDLLLVRVELVLHVALLSKQGVQVRALLIVLVFDVHKQSLNVLRLGVTSVLVEGQVIVGQVAFELSDIFDQSFVFALQG